MSCCYSRWIHISEKDVWLSTNRIDSSRVNCQGRNYSYTQIPELRSNLHPCQTFVDHRQFHMHLPPSWMCKYVLWWVYKFTWKHFVQFQDELYIFGDFNIHLEKASVNTRSFLDILKAFSLHQHITFPTHIYGHWLDMFITRSNCKHVEAVSSSDGLSNHLTVLIDLWLQIKSSPEKANITFRPINIIDLDSLHMELSHSDILMHPKTSLLELTAQFSETLSHLLDKHPPKQTKVTQPRPTSPLVSLEIILAKRRRRYLERVWRRTRSPLDRSRYTKQLELCNRMMSKSKSDYYTSLLSKNSANPRHMWNSITILQREKSKPLPDYTSLDTLCSSFSKFFTDKIISSSALISSKMLKIQWVSSYIQLPESSKYHSKIYKCFMRSWPISNTSSQTLYRWFDCSYHRYH